MIRQGVTTEVVGNCGFSPAPLTPEHADTVRSLHGFFGSFIHDLDWSWRSYGEFADRLGSGGLGLNVAPLVGHVTVRAAVMGYAQRPPSAGELGRMQDLVRSAMRDGCFGLSTGLVYPPGAYADTEEIVELARVAGEAGGLYASHIRGEGHSLLRAVAEAIEVGERGRARVQISHHKAAFRPYWGVRHATQPSEWAHERGQDVTFDVYPYTAGSAPLTQIIPDWAHEGGLPALVARLGDPGEPGPARARGGRAGARVGSDAGGRDADGAGQGRRGRLHRRHRRASRRRSGGSSPHAPRGVRGAGHHRPPRHQRGRRAPRHAAPPRRSLGRLGAVPGRTARGGQAASPLLRHVPADPRRLRP